MQREKESKPNTPIETKQEEIATQPKGAARRSSEGRDKTYYCSKHELVGGRDKE